MKYHLHDERYSEAFINRPHRVYGKRLLPFSLWHQHLLEHAQSPVLVGAGCTPMDLLHAVRLCSTPWNPAFHVDLTPPSLPALLVASAGRRFHKELAAFGAYLADYCSSPKLWEKVGQGSKARDVDSIIEQAAYLVKQGFTWEQAWTMPIGVGAWSSVVMQKIDGAEIDIFTPDDEARYQEHVRKREAKLDEEGRRIAEAEGIPYAAARQRAYDAYWAKYRKTPSSSNATRPDPGNGT